MHSEFVPKSQNENSDVYGESVFSKMIKAGHRTYFIDVKVTRLRDYFLSITELRKKFAPDGSFTSERNKVFVYQEDFDKFTEGLSEVLDFVKRSKQGGFSEK